MAAGGKKQASPQKHSVYGRLTVVDVSDRMVGHGVGVLERLVRAGQFPHEPLTVSERRVLRIRYAV